MQNVDSLVTVSASSAALKIAFSLSSPVKYTFVSDGRWDATLKAELLISRPDLNNIDVSSCFAAVLNKRLITLIQELPSNAANKSNIRAMHR